MSALSVDKLVQHDIAYEYENVLVARSKHHSMLWGLLVDYVKRENIQITPMLNIQFHFVKGMQRVIPS